MSELAGNTGELMPKTEYGAVMELLAEARIELNLQVLEGLPQSRDLVDTVDFWSKKARDLAIESNEIIIQ
jgi:hypothetical protein